MRKAPMMRLRAGMNLAGGGGRVDEVEGARSCEARPGCSAASSESAIGERVLGPCIDSSMAKSRPVLSSSRRWLLPCVVGVVVVWRLVFGSRRWFAKRAKLGRPRFFIVALSGSGLSSGKSRRWRF